MSEGERVNQTVQLDLQEKLHKVIHTPIIQLKMRNFRMVTVDAIIKSTINVKQKSYLKINPKLTSSETAQSAIGRGTNQSAETHELAGEEEEADESGKRSERK